MSILIRRKNENYNTIENEKKHRHEEENRLKMKQFNISHITGICSDSDIAVQNYRHEEKKRDNYNGKKFIQLKKKSELIDAKDFKRYVWAKF